MKNNRSLGKLITLIASVREGYECLRQCQIDVTVFKGLEESSVLILGLADGGSITMLIMVHLHLVS